MKVTCKICGIVDKPHRCPHSKRKTDRSRKDKQIYSKSIWQRVRNDVIETFNYMCLWSFYIDGEVVTANEVHHIIELLEDDTLAYDDDNLIPLSWTKHKLIHELYRTGRKEETQKLLRDMQKSFLSGNRVPGYYKSKFEVPPGDFDILGPR